MFTAFAPLGIVLLVMVIAGVFIFTSIKYWIDAQAIERRERERFALFRKLAEQPPESARLVVELLREEDAKRAEADRRKAHQKRREGLHGGLVVVAVGVGLSATVLPVEPRVFMVGLIPILVGTVVFLFALFDKPTDHTRSNSSSS